jgi:hypothetical protein
MVDCNTEALDKTDLSTYRGPENPTYKSQTLTMRAENKGEIASLPDSFTGHLYW